MATFLNGSKWISFATNGEVVAGGTPASSTTWFTSVMAAHALSYSTASNINLGVSRIEVAGTEIYEARMRYGPAHCPLGAVVVYPFGLTGFTLSGSETLQAKAVQQYQTPTLWSAMFVGQG